MISELTKTFVLPISVIYLCPLKVSCFTPFPISTQIDLFTCANFRVARLRWLWDNGRNQKMGIRESQVWERASDSDSSTFCECDDRCYSKMPRSRIYRVCEQTG